MRNLSQAKSLGPICFFGGSWRVGVAVNIFLFHRKDRGFESRTRYLKVFVVWPVRSAVRMPVPHMGDRGSIPLQAIGK